MLKPVTIREEAHVPGVAVLVTMVVIVVGLAGYAEVNIQALITVNPIEHTNTVIHDESGEGICEDTQTS